jgi:hypothetical protein
VPFGASPIEIQRFDVQATAAHEFGHVIGLGHSRSSQNVMFGIAQWADYGDWKLGLGDSAAMLVNYPCPAVPCQRGRRRKHWPPPC